VSQENREELIRALEEARHHLKNDSIEALQEAVKKLNDSIYKFSAAVQSAGAGQQQTTESTSSQNTEQSNDGQHKH
jgi:predicted  nucleic acid-binding Zn-ribbon protein